MTMFAYTKQELSRINDPEPSETKDYLNACLLDLMEIISQQRHTPRSALELLSYMRRLVRFKPLTPLTGEESEWATVFDNKQQNRRCFSIFRLNGDNSTAYDSEGVLFSDDDGQTWFTDVEKSKIPVAFPYVPPNSPMHVVLNTEDKQ